MSTSSPIKPSFTSTSASLQRWAGLAIFFAGVGVSISDVAHLAAAA